MIPSVLRTHFIALLALAASIAAVATFAFLAHAAPTTEDAAVFAPLLATPIAGLMIAQHSSGAISALIFRLRAGHIETVSDHEFHERMRIAAAHLAVWRHAAAGRDEPVILAAFLTRDWPGNPVSIRFENFLSEVLTAPPDIAGHAKLQEYLSGILSPKEEDSRMLERFADTRDNLLQGSYFLVALPDLLKASVPFGSISKHDALAIHARLEAAGLLPA